jgi:cyclopropane fatty-acyl-phospholipid synthase-like methyltransferase
LPGNLAEIRKWLTGDTDAFNWDGMLGSMLRHLTGSAGDLARKKQRLRTVGRDLLHVDLCRPSILDVDRKYDLVTSFHCAECVAQNKTEWWDMKKRILNLVQPGGGVFFSAVYNCVSYQVLGKWFPVIPTIESDYEALLNAETFQDVQITRHDCPEFAESGFSQVLLVSGFKLGATQI